MASWLPLFRTEGRCLHYHVVTHGDKAGAEIIRVHHACLLLWGSGTKTQGGSEEGGRTDPEPVRRGTDARGRMRCTVSESGRAEGHRRSRCKYTSRENVHRKEEDRAGRCKSPSTVQRTARREEGRHGAGSHGSQPRAESEVRAAGGGARWGQVGAAEDKPHGPQKRGDREIQTDREEKKEKHALFLAPAATPECAPCRRRVPGGRCQYHNPS